jgi:hypothetical protein
VAVEDEVGFTAELAGISSSLQALPEIEATLPNKVADSMPAIVLRSFKFFNIFTLLFINNLIMFQLISY